jgi:hypothetical protein
MPVAAQQITVGEHIPVRIETPQDYKGTSATQYGEHRWYYKLIHPEATYMALHFRDFDLGDGDVLMVSDPSGEQSYVLAGRGKMEAGTFWARHIKGDTVILNFIVTSAEGGRGFTIDEYVAGFVDIGGDPRAICGADDKENAICYTGSHPVEYGRARAVCRLLSNGSGFCTGWLCSAQNHVMTNEHCVSSSSSAMNTDFDFMAEAPTCSTPNCQNCFPGTVYGGGGIFIQDNYNLDYCLMQINVLPGEMDPAGTFGYLELDNRVAVPGEEIYIVGHPGARAKEMSIYSTHPNDPNGIPVVYSISEPACQGSGYSDVGYFADTEGGSSGSPVLARSSHKVIALHHCAYCPNRGVPIHLIYPEVQQYLTPGPTGAIELDKGVYGCADTIGIDLRDGDLQGTGAHDVVVSTTGGDTETVTLTETPANSAIFLGSIATDDAGVVVEDGTVQVADGQTVTVAYLDADNGQGGFNVTVTDTAAVDCVAPQITGVQITNIEPRSATVVITANEPVLGVVHYGLACANLQWTQQGAGYSLQATVNLASLQDDTTYFLAVEAEDEGGNVATDDNNGNCYTFTTPQTPDYFTELFDGSDNDLANWGLQFVPNGSVDYYAGCAESITALPTDPAGGTPISLSDDDYEQVTLAGGATVKLYGVSYGSFYVGSNGYLTFGSGDTDTTESLNDHFEQPRISALFDDLNPASGGSVSWKQLSDRVAVTFQNVPEYSIGGSNTFQYELFFDGRITVSYLAVSCNDGLAGLSAGNGVSPDYYETDLTNMGPCVHTPPTAFDSLEALDAGVPTVVSLPADDDGFPIPPGVMTYVIVSLPAHGVLRDPGAGPIASVPYTLVNHGHQVEFTSSAYYVGADGFQWKANDGGVPPEGGDSNVATLSLDILGVKRIIHDFPLDSDPGWSGEGEWAYGQPTGQGSYWGDPVSGYTGADVYGYNLDGDYSNYMPARYLTTPGLDCTGVTAVELRFGRWLAVEEFDTATIEVSNDGVNWVVVYDNLAARVNENAWSFMQYDISAVADNQATVYVRWGMGPTDGSYTMAGWNIDDVQLWGVAPAWCLGDSDCSGVVDFTDIEHFVAALGGASSWVAYYQAHHGGALPMCPYEVNDMNGGGVTFTDIRPFIDHLGQPCDPMQ